MFYLDPIYFDKEVIFTISKIFEKNKVNQPSSIFNNLLEGFDFAEVEKDKIIVYFGNRVPIIINTGTSIENLAYYLGCYFSDGTKRGWAWGICASTFEQARYFINMHKHIINDSNLIFSISFTDINKQDKVSLKNELAMHWQNNINVLLDENKVRIVESNRGFSPKTNHYGTLIIKEFRELTIMHYNRLLLHLFKRIEEENNKELAIDFLCGVLEGDGTVNAKNKGHIIICSNAKEVKILGNVLKSTGLKFKVYMEGENRGFIRIGSLEIIRNISILKDKIFKYYPKRRNLLKERLLNTASVKFLLGENKKTSNWLIGQFNEMGILDGNGNLTDFGTKIKEDLREFLIG